MIVGEKKRDLKERKGVNPYHFVEKVAFLFHSKVSGIDIGICDKDHLHTHLHS